MLIGYACDFTQDQEPEKQLNALKKAGCEKIFTEKDSGARRDRPQLKAALKHMQEGDFLVVWKADRLARSPQQFFETIKDLEKRKIGLRSIIGPIDTTFSGDRPEYHITASFR